MRTEISTLFHLLSADESAVANALIGGGVSIERLDHRWIESVREQCSRVSAREELEGQKPYTHRFFYEIEGSTNEFFQITSEQQQPLLRVISLSRLVKPTSIPYSNVWVKSELNSDGVRHFSYPVINNYSVAYGQKEHQWNTITDIDTAEMSKLWASLSYFLDDKYEPSYRRIVRALKNFELAHGIYFAQFRYPIIHAALESMICTTRKHGNRAQVTQRLPQLVPFISARQAEDIYLLCCDLKHAAQAMLQESIETGPFSPSDQKRIDSTGLLHEAVRYLLLRSLSDRSFADTLADIDKLKTAYRVLDAKGKLI